jgi:hypothetical protein
MFSKNNLSVELFYCSGDYEFPDLIFKVIANNEIRYDQVSYLLDHKLYNYIFDNNISQLEKNYYDILL